MKNIGIDLHIHSHHSSDGEYGVEQIVERCEREGIERFSITDHNSAKANKLGEEIAKQKGLKYISGIEIDCLYKGVNLHLLGYGVDWRCREFELLEREVEQKQRESIEQLVKNLAELGFRIDLRSVLDYAGGALPTAELIAEVMLSDPKFDRPLLKPYTKGEERGDMPYINFYLDYCAQGKPAHVEIEYISFAEAVELIESKGGTPIVAHPGLNLKGQESIAAELLEAGAKGLEVFNNYHTLEQSELFASIVVEKGALMSCGSDFHGKTKPLIEVGQFGFIEQYESYLLESVDKLFGKH